MRYPAVAVCLMLAVFPVLAATFDVPSDHQLLGRADLVVVATVLDSSSREAEDRMILTDHHLRVEQVIKGHAPATIVVSEAGGIANGHGVEIAGSASYEAGTRVLAFLRQRNDGTYYTAYMGLGKYRFTRDGDTEYLVRDADGIDATSGQPADMRDANAFLASLRNGKPEHAPHIAPTARPDFKVATNAPPSAYVLSSIGPKRWQFCDTGCEIGFIINQVQPGVNTTLGLDHAFAAWTDHPNSFVDLFANGIGAKTNYTNDDINDIVFNWDGTSPHSSCEGAKGCGIVFFNAATHVFRGETFFTLVSADVVIRNVVNTQTAFESILTHELGHALAFRHADQGTPSGTGIMLSSVPTNLGATLGPWDSDALTVVYGPGLACVPVGITSTSGGGVYPYGSTAFIGASGTGDPPVTFQWYEGFSGDTSHPISGATSAGYTTPPITELKRYWLRASNSCPSHADSPTITVEPAPCTGASITTEPVSQRVTPGSTASLHVAANGTSPLTYHWYRSGTVGDTSSPVGTNSPDYTTPALSTTTSYWVRVSNACGQDDSALATITVGTTCVPASITSQPTTINLQLGQGATLQISTGGDSPFTYQWYAGNSGDLSQPLPGQTSATFVAGPFNIAGTYRFWVKVTNQCGNASSATVTVNVACPQIELPLLSAPAVTHYSTGYDVSWTGELAVSPTFELQESTTSDFTANVKNFTITGAKSKHIDAHQEVTAETRIYYRVRAISACTQQPTAFSETASTVVTPPLPPESVDFSISVPEGTTQPITQQYLVPGFDSEANNNDTFAITTDVDWMTIFPASGALSAGGTTVQITINPAGLEPGSLHTTLHVTRTHGASGKVGTNDGPVNTYTPFSFSLVTPVSPDPRDGNPPPGTLIIPAVAHAQGIGSAFHSDVRIVNVSFDAIDYEITYTPSQTDGTQEGKKTTLTIHAGDTLAFDDIVKSWYGAGVLGEGGVGTIEIRPLNGANPFATFASSRTYAIDGGGTLGQFIPALRLDSFIGNIANDSLNRISLQQVANSAVSRTNLGFVEGTGTPVSILARLLDGNNNVLAQVTRDLNAFGHLQQSLTAMFGDVNLPDGRVEVEETNGSGKVSAYASVLNNLTNDPLMVFPVQPARSTAGRYVLAGIAEFASSFSNFHSDMRIYNGGVQPVNATLNYYDRGASTPHPQAPARQVTLAPGQVYAVNDVLPTLWPGLIGGGSVVVTGPNDSSLVVTAQTFSRQANGGTKGQFIPGVTAQQGVGFGERAMEVLQLEQSPLSRSNVGFVEITGKPAVIEVTATDADTKFTAVVPISLQANEYRQFDRILEQMGLGTVYNGRVSVKVIEGEGRVYAYGSTVDNRTEDPTYVPGQ